MEKILVARVSTPLRFFFFLLEFKLFFVSLMFFSKNDMSYLTRKLPAVLLLVLGPENRCFKDLNSDQIQNWSSFKTAPDSISLCDSITLFLSYLPTHHTILICFIFKYLSLETYCNVSLFYPSSP